MYNKLYIIGCKVYYTFLIKRKGVMTRIESKIVIYNTIQELRLSRNITQQDLANGVNVTRATIIALEKGNYNPSLELAFRLATFFKININKLFYINGA